MDSCLNKFLILTSEFCVLNSAFPYCVINCSRPSGSLTANTLRS